MTAPSVSLTVSQVMAALIAQQPKWTGLQTVANGPVAKSLQELIDFGVVFTEVPIRASYYKAPEAGVIIGAYGIKQICVRLYRHTSVLIISAFVGGGPVFYELTLDRPNYDVELRKFSDPLTVLVT